VVIPPEYLCCGYPYLANGQTRLAETKSYENRVIFHKMADVMGYMEIESVIVSCGTCYEMLESYELGTVFPEAELMDVSEYIVKNGLYGGAGNACDEKEVLLYHDPCHSPLKHYGYKKTISAAAGRIPELIPFCCGEGGTLALSPPDLSNSLRTRKVRILAPFVEKKHTTLLTTCPSCVQGLSKIRSRLPLSVKSLNIYLAERHLGQGWKKRFLRDVKRGGFENILF